MLRVRNFALANLAAMIFFAGFGAMLLAGVLYLTQVWDYSILHAGVALSPGPLTAALFAAPSGRLGGRIGQRPIAALGARQLGAAIGVAVLVALLADPAPDALLGALRHGWAFMLGTGLGTAALSLALGPVRAEEATARKPDVAPQPQPAAAK